MPILPSKPSENAAGRVSASRRDEAVDLAVTEAPATLLLHHLVRIGAARADPRTIGAILHHGPVGAHPCPVAVERDHDVGDEVDAARPVRARLLANAAREGGDGDGPRRRAERRLPGAVRGEEGGHLVEAALIEVEAVLRHDLADGVLFLERGRHKPSSRLHPPSSRRKPGSMNTARREWIPAFAGMTF